MSNTEKQFSVHNIYTKDVSFESPKAPHVFTKEWAPKLNFDLAMSSSKIEDNIYEVTIKLTLDVKLPKDQAANDSSKEEDLEVVFISEVLQAGVFFIKGLQEDELEMVLSVRAPEILFPYAREAISNLATRGGFPQLLLPPVNFEAMYIEHKQKQPQKEESLVD